MSTLSKRKSISRSLRKVIGSISDFKRVTLEKSIPESPSRSSSEHDVNERGKNEQVNSQSQPHEDVILISATPSFRIAPSTPNVTMSAGSQLRPQRSLMIRSKKVNKPAKALNHAKSFDEFVFKPTPIFVSTTTTKLDPFGLVKRGPSDVDGEKGQLQSVSIQLDGFRQNETCTAILEDRPIIVKSRARTLIQAEEKSERRVTPLDFSKLLA